MKFVPELYLICLFSSGISNTIKLPGGGKYVKIKTKLSVVLLTVCVGVFTRNMTSPSVLLLSTLLLAFSLPAALYPCHSDIVGIKVRGETRMEAGQDPVEEIIELEM